MSAYLDERSWARLDALVDRSAGPGACWPWLGSRSKRGTPYFCVSKTRSCSPRRPVWDRAFGEPPPRDRIVKFSCGNLLCMNPQHMLVASAEERFWSRVKKSDGCWEWTGPRKNSRSHYGAFFPKQGEHWAAHRYAYTLAHGPIPDGLLVCHRCDNPPCVRPDHLFLGTDRANHDDMVSKGRHAHGPTHAARMKIVAARLRAEGRFFGGKKVDDVG